MLSGGVATIMANHSTLNPSLYVGFVLINRHSLLIPQVMH